MADTARSLSALQTLLADNIAGDISAQDLRDFLVTSLMTTSVQSVTVSDVTAAIGIHYELTISGLTAERSFILPVASVGDRIRVKLMTDAPDDYELVIKGAATVTINNGTAATEWSRLLIKDEVVELRATSATNWDVVNDGRIVARAKIIQTTNQAISASTYTELQMDTEEYNRGSVVNLTTNDLTIKRSGYFLITLQTSVGSASGSQAYVFPLLDGVLDFHAGNVFTVTQFNGPQLATSEIYIAKGGSISVGFFVSNSGSTRATSDGFSPFISIQELF